MREDSGLVFTSVTDHQFDLKGLNSLYNYAPIVGASGNVRDKHDLATFGLVFYYLISDHHQAEDQILFPSLEEQSKTAGLMSINVQQHESFHSGIETLFAYLTSITKDAKATTFDAERLQGLINSFRPALMQHLHKEISTLLECGRRFPDIDIRPIERRFEAQMRSKGYGASPVTGLTQLLPWIIACHDRGFDGGKWAEYLPSTAKTLGRVATWTTKLSYRGIWRFAPCSFSSELKREM